MSRGGPALAVLTGEAASGTLSRTLTSRSVAVELNECVWAVVACLYTPQPICNNIHDYNYPHVSHGFIMNHTSYISLGDCSLCSYMCYVSMM